MEYNKLMILQFLIWQFFDMPKAILKGWRNFLLFNLNYFSIPILLKTFFSHWHRYYFPYGKKWDPMRWIEAFVGNIFSRIIGIIFRTVFIIIGLLIEIFILIVGIIIFVSWFVLPVLLLAGLWFSLRIIL